MMGLGKGDSGFFLMAIFGINSLDFWGVTLKQQKNLDLRGAWFFAASLMKRKSTPGDLELEIPCFVL